MEKKKTVGRHDWAAVRLGDSQASIRRPAVCTAAYCGIRYSQDFTLSALVDITRMIS